MKRFFTLAAMLFFFGQMAFAQLPDGSIAPDFTATDINGVEHNLYDILDQGKSVVLDVSATWCGPCWTYHTSGVLEQLWEEHGPNGADDIYVFMIEGDADTSLDDIYGTGNNTLGDWTQGVDYPIIDSPDISSAYAITYYPTLYHICPDKTVTEIGQVQLGAYVDANGACAPWVFGDNNAAAAGYSGDSNVDCGSESVVTPRMMLRNMGMMNLTSADVTFSMDGMEQETVSWSGDLATLEEAEVSFADVTVNTTANFSFEISNVNGVADENSDDNVLATQVGVELTTSNIVDFSIVTDFWPEEIAWELIDDAGAVLYSDDEFGALMCDNLYEQTFELEVGKCYTFSITDAFGDGILNGPINPSSHSCGTENGMASQAMGEISIASSQGVIYDDIAYGSGIDVTFYVNEMSTGINELEVGSINLFPNPTTDVLNVNFDLEEREYLQIDVYNMMGQRVQTVTAQQFETGIQSLQVNTNNLSNGVYILRMQGADAQLNRQFVVNK